MSPPIRKLRSDPCLGSPESRAHRVAWSDRSPRRSCSGHQYRVRLRLAPVEARAPGRPAGIMLVCLPSACSWRPGARNRSAPSAGSSPRWPSSVPTSTAAERQRLPMRAVGRVLGHLRPPRRLAEPRPPDLLCVPPGPGRRALASGRPTTFGSVWNHTARIEATYLVTLIAWTTIRAGLSHPVRHRNGRRSKHVRRATCRVQRAHVQTCCVRRATTCGRRSLLARRTPEPSNRELRAERTHDDRSGLLANAESGLDSRCGFLPGHAPCGRRRSVVAVTTIVSRERSLRARRLDRSAVGRGPFADDSARRRRLSSCSTGSCRDASACRWSWRSA